MTAIVRRASWSKHALTLFLASACSVCGCSDRPSFGSTDMGTRYPDDAWIRRQPPPMSSVDARLPQSQFCEAGELEQEAALARLETSPFVALTPDELRVYSRGKLTLPSDGGVAVLLRCVRPALEGHDPRGDAVSVAWRDGTVAVMHLSLRSRYTPWVRRAVVAILPALPREVFVQPMVAY